MRFLGKCVCVATMASVVALASCSDSEGKEGNDRPEIIAERDNVDARLATLELPFDLFEQWRVEEGIDLLRGRLLGDAGSPRWTLPLDENTAATRGAQIDARLAKLAENLERDSYYPAYDEIVEREQQRSNAGQPVPLWVVTEQEEEASPALVYTVPLFFAKGDGGSEASSGIGDILGFPRESNASAFHRVFGRTMQLELPTSVEVGTNWGRLSADSSAFLEWASVFEEVAPSLPIRTIWHIEHSEGVLVLLAGPQIPGWIEENGGRKCFSVDVSKLPDANAVQAMFRRMGAGFVDVEGGK